MLPLIVMSLIIGVVAIVVLLKSVKTKELSFARLINSAQESLKRFPLVVLSAVLAASLSTYLALSQTEHFSYYILIVGTFTLGISLFLALGLLAESLGRSKFIFQVIGVCILLLAHWSYY